MPTLQEKLDVILGPQAPIGTSYFDRTQVERGKVHGTACPVDPPTGEALDPFVMLQYYDLPLCEYIAYQRTGDVAFRDLARKCADAWFKHPWISEGRTRLWITEESVSPPPRHAGVSGLILRAMDSRPEMWDWTNAYTRFHFDHWLKARVSSGSLFYGVREGAFMLQFAAQLAVALPDSFPLQSGGQITNGADLRARYRADCELVATEYFGRLQQADGSWRWDDFDEVEADGGSLRGIMQPFMVGLLLDALIDVHRISTNDAVKTSIQNQITKACRHLYLDGPYMTQLVPSLGVKRRGFAYYYHGGTSTNPTKYQNGNYPATWDTRDPSDVQNVRQAIGPLVAAYGYAYQLTKDPFFKLAGDELWDSAYGETDKIRNYMAGDAKSYNQNCRGAGPYLVWSGGVFAPVPEPEPIPDQPTPTTPTKLESPDGTKATTIVDSEQTVWTLGTGKETLREGIQAGGGQGTLYKYFGKVVYVLGLDSNWYKWENGWAVFGASEPGVTAPTPTPTPIPEPDPIPEPQPPAAPRIVKWPNSFNDQAALWQAQAKERYRPNRPVPRPAGQPKGNYVEFVGF